MGLEAVIFYAVSIAVLTVMFVVAFCGRKVKEAKSTRHVISLPIGARFILDDSDSVWVLIHLVGCGLSAEWKGNDYSGHVQLQRQIVGKDEDLKHVVVRVVQ